MRRGDCLVNEWTRSGVECQSSFVTRHINYQFANKRKLRILLVERVKNGFFSYEYEYQRDYYAS
jgi:hypothetical protein